MTEVINLLVEIQTSIVEIRKVSDQMVDWNQYLGENEAYDTVRTIGNTIIKGIHDGETALISHDQKTWQDVINFENKLIANLYFLRGNLGGFDPKVTQGAKQRLTDLKSQWAASKVEFSKLIEQVDDYNKIYKELNIPAIILFKIPLFF